MTSVKKALTAGSRRRRYAAVLVPSVVLAGVTVALVGQGALAASFAVSGSSFKLSADRLEGTGFVSYNSVNVKKDGSSVAVAPAGFASAKLTNLCQSVVSPTPFGKVTLRLTAGTAAPAEAKNLIADFDSLQGDVTFTDYSSGLDASDLTGGPTTGPAGMWGQQAGTVTIDNLHQNTWATTAATFVLKGLSIDVSFDGDECF